MGEPQEKHDCIPFLRATRCLYQGHGTTRSLFQDEERRVIGSEAAACIAVGEMDRPPSWGG